MNAESNNSKYVIRTRDPLTRRWEFLDLTTGDWQTDPHTLPMYLTQELAKKAIELTTSRTGAVPGEAVSLEKALRDLHQ